VPKKRSAAGRFPDWLLPVAIAVCLCIPRLTLGYFWDDYTFLSNVQRGSLVDFLPFPQAVFYRPLSRGVSFLLLFLLGPVGNIAGHLPGFGGITLAEWTHQQFDTTVSWKDVEWIRSIWPGKLVLKGILDPEDAREALKTGADAVVVSNHGGRQLDGAPSTIAALPKIADAIGGQKEILIDSGIRTGQDIFRALALGEAYRVAVTMGWEQSPDAALKEADALAHKALSLSDEDVRAHSLLGLIQIYYGRYEQALAELDRATAINPNDADAVAGRGTVLCWSGRTEEGSRELEAARRIDPALHRFVLGLAYYLTGKYDAAIEVLSRNLSERPDASHSGAVLAASYRQQGRGEEAARAVATVRRFDPAFEVGAFGAQLQKPADRERLREGLRKAGL